MSRVDHQVERDLKEQRAVERADKQERTNRVKIGMMVRTEEADGTSDCGVVLDIRRSSEVCLVKCMGKGTRWLPIAHCHRSAMHNRPEPDRALQLKMMDP